MSKEISSDKSLDSGAQNGRVLEVIKNIRSMSLPAQREVLARIWPEQAARSGDKVWISVRFDENLRVVAYSEEQETYVRELRELLLGGALARLENEGDGNYEIYGPDRTYYVTMTPERGFVGLLSSWTPQNPPQDAILEKALD